MPANTQTTDDLLHRAQLAVESNEFPVAEELYRSVMQLDPLDVRARQILGALLAERNRAEEAVEILRVAAALVGPLTKDTTAVYNNLANALRCAKEYDESAELMRQLCAISPDTWEHWHNLGHLLRDTDRLDEAAAAMRRAILLNPGHGPSHAVLGHILHDLGRLRSAEASLKRCIELGWNTDVNVWTVLGNNYRWLGQMDKALQSLETALEVSGGDGSAHNNLAIVLTQSGRFEEAFEHYHAALAQDPENRVWHANYGYALLTAGRVPEGWVEWEYGIINHGPRGGERALGVPRWTPELGDSRVICYREQGVGDEILFASCLPDLADAAREVIYECEPRLVTLMTRSFPQLEVRPQSWNEFGETMTDFDYFIPMGSLPLHFRRSVDAFPSDRRSYLVADPERVAKWKDRFASFEHGTTVCFAWRSKVKTAERRVEYTSLLDDWGPLFSIPGVNWVSVQYDDCERELSTAERQYGVTLHRWDDVDYLNDFDEVAAMMVASDYVVAPRNAVAMLGGALGVPTVMMGNRWDWSDIGTDTSPWFPTVELVFRHFGEDWDKVIERAAARVTDVVASRSVEPLGLRQTKEPTR